MKAIVLNLYIFFEVGAVVLAIISYLIWDKRYHQNHGNTIPAGFERTEEVTIDPSTGKKLRVYFNTKTGERFYYEEKNIN